MGLGITHFEPKDYKFEDLGLIVPIEMGDDNFKARISVDYCHGRMVKLILLRLGDDEWEVRSPYAEPNPEYQSWERIYATIESLITSVVQQEQPS